MASARIREIEAEIALEVARGNVALWLGAEARFSDFDHPESFVRLPWLAIWTESTDSAMAKALAKNWEERQAPGSRQVVEVPNRLEETLGTYYSIAQLCPVYYLNGRNGEWAEFPRREQRRARDEKIDEVAKLGSSVLLFSGFRDVDRLLEVLVEELPEVEADLRLVISAADDQLLTDLARGVLERKPSLLRRLRAFRPSLGDLAHTVAKQLESRPLEGPSVRVAEDYVPIDALLQREGPIDQHFFLLTARDLEEPAPEITDLDLIEAFMAGKTRPWHALSRKALWARPFESDHPLDALLGALHRRRGGDSPPVTCFTIAAESGSGLTTLLQELAFHAARSGYPSLIKRNEVPDFDYDALRVYLEYVQARGDGQHPALIVIDDADSPLNQTNDLTGLPLRLARDGRHVVFLRGIRIGRNQDFDQAFRQEKRFPLASPKVEELWFEAALRARLTAREVETLCGWAEDHWPATNAASLRQATQTWARDWDGEGLLPPLLISLYILLRDNLAEPSRLGRHIVSKVTALSSELSSFHEQEAQAARSAQPLSGESLERAAELLQRSFKGGPPQEHLDEQQEEQLRGARAHRPAPEHLEEVFTLLCVFGAVRVLASKAVLTALVNLPRAEVEAALDELEELELVIQFFNPADESSDTLARDAFYTVASPVGLVHPSFGRLVLEHLEDNDGQATLRGGGDWLAEIASSAAFVDSPLYPIRLLAPVFRRLRATTEEVRFAAATAQRLLRLQRVRGSHYHQWLFATSQADNMLEVLDHLPENVLRQSANLLHTRGITRYKSCSRARPLADCRERYAAAAADLELAYDRSTTEHEGEAPAHVVTSLGLLYLGWSEHERRRVGEGGTIEQADRTRRLAKRYLREGLQLQPDNPYAAYGLASIAIEVCEDLARASLADERASEYASNLAEAFEFLQHRPDATVAEEWEDLHRRAIELLDGEAADKAIARLRRRGDDLWRALEVMQLLRGVVPFEITAAPEEEKKLSKSWEILGFSAPSTDTESILSNMLRYAVFTSMPERLKSPDFHRRFELISRLEETRFLETPLLRFDHGMLASQTGNYVLGEESFRWLRRGRRFLEVPMERATLLCTPESNGTVPITAQLRVSVAARDGQGWGRVQEPKALHATIPFSPQEFRSSGVPSHPGAVAKVRIKVRPAGLFAVPPRTR